MDSMERWYEASKQRFSVRKYSGAPDEAQLAALEGMAELLCAQGVRIALGRSAEVFKPIFLWYGKITGTDAFAAIIEKGAQPEMVGYVGEAFALECTAMGVGTCWLGASYSKSKAASMVKLEEGERIACILSLGIAAEEYIARPRKSLEKLTGLTSEQFGELPVWQKRAFECARHAPSAMNKQPWAFKAEGEKVTIENTSANFGYGKIDCGIAMLHIELGAANSRVSGEWKSEGEGVNTFIPQGVSK